ncbi:MAG: sodium-dependent transporter [Firmicutes bacterium]|nr:sodium-dependent transporter [Bacillota bacterium]
MGRENFSSRLGFILVSAGCAIGIGNVWKFPYLCGAYGGAAFILIYLIFLVIMGIPVMVCEFAVGRASRTSVAMSFDKLEPWGTYWHTHKIIGISGCYLLLMFYTSVGGWLMNYCVKGFSGDFQNIEKDAIEGMFGDMMADTSGMIFWTVLICIIGFVICVFGLQNGVERVSKFMMVALLAIMVILAIRSVFLPGALSGVKFYLIPDFKKMAEIGIGDVIFNAMSQAFFTLSIGIGAMLIFGSHLDRRRSLTGEAVSITLLDTFVALTSGFIIIPACFAFAIEPGAGPSLIFITLPNIFSQMAMGQLWGGLFFLFLTFAALTTIVAVVENLVSFNIDLFGWSRTKSVLVSGILLTILSMPCVLGFNLWSGIQPFGEDSTIMDLEDFIVSNNLLPLGSMGYILFCTCRNGWGWKNFIREANQGEGMKFPVWLRPYVQYVIPLIIAVIYLKGYYDKFYGQPILVFLGWMALAIALLIFVIYCVFVRKKI